MYYRLKKIFFTFLLFLISSPSYAIVAGGNVSVQHEWPTHSEFDQLSFCEQINHDGGEKSHYSWANQFFFKNGNAGYIGLQNSKEEHFVNDSIWKATGWKSKQCHYFDYEGSGVQCQIKMPRKTGHPYKLNVSKKDNLVTGVIIDLMDDTETTVGVIEVPQTFGKFNGSLSFVEEYSQGSEQLSSCFVMGMQSAIFRAPIGNKTVKAKQSTYTYRNCNDPYVVQAACNDEACINTVSNLGGMLLPHALEGTPEVSLVNGQDLSAQTISDALKKADLIVIRSQDGYWTPHIYFPKPHLLKGKSIFVDHRANYSSSLHVDNSVKEVKIGTQLMYMSDGNRWNIIKTH